MVDGPWASCTVAFLALLIVVSMAPALAPVPSGTARSLALTDARFSPPHADLGVDGDGDGRFDFLAVDVNLAVDVPGDYFLYGGLRGSGGGPITTTSETPRLDVGGRTVRLLFDGVAINESGVDGPYTVDLALERMDEPLDADAHVTAAYDHASFESPLAHFAPPHAEGGVDLDGDGRFELLGVNASVRVETAGQYVFRAWLHDREGRLQVIEDGTFDLGLGTRTVGFAFDGAKINASGVDGPYTVDLWLFTPDHRHSDFNTFPTAAYRSSDFNGVPSEGDAGPIE